MLESIFESSVSTAMTMENLFICLISSIIFGVLISLTHMKTTTYSKNFIQTLVLLPVIVSIVIIMVNGNLGAGVAVAGAFSLVRFRSVPGNSKEIMSVFFAMAIGLAIGMGHVLFSGISTIIVCLAIIILNKIKLGEKKNISLTIVIPENLDYTNIFDDLFMKYTNKWNLERVKTTNMGSLFELSYNIDLKDKINEKEFIDEIRCRNGNLKILLNHGSLEGEL